MKLTVMALLVVVGALGTAQLHAHHSFSAEFDAKKPITIEGTITKVELTNPHAWIFVNVKGPDGRVKNYAIQTSAPVALIRNGGDKKTLAIGRTVTVDGWLAHNGSDTALGRTIKVDGKSISGEAADTAFAAQQD